MSQEVTQELTVLQVLADREGNLKLVTRKDLPLEVRRLVLEKIEDALCCPVPKLSRKRCRGAVGH